MKKREAAKFNDESKSGKTPLGLAIENDNLKTIEYLVKAGADPNKSASSIGVSYAPLNLAVISSKSEVVKELLKYKADVNGIDSLGYVPLQNLFSKPKYNKADLEIAKLLVEHGANIYVLTPEGKRLEDLLPKDKKPELLVFLEECYEKDHKKNNINFEQKSFQKSFVLKEEKRKREDKKGVSR